MADPPPAPVADDPTTTMAYQAPQLSPLSGAYLLIVVGEPFSEEHKKLILNKLQQGLSTWNTTENHVDLEAELTVITDCAPPGEEARGGERLIQFATENLVTEVLIHPQVNTLQQCMKNMLASFTKHRHIVHAGYTFAGQGSWILQDGTFSFEDFATTFEEYDVQRVIRSYENSISIDVHCCEEGEWKQDKIEHQSFAKLCKVKINPVAVVGESKPVTNFISYVEPFLQPQSIQERLPPSDVVGNIRFSHPTLYVFPGGQGDSALFGINGFNMLIDGGFSRKACFWDFTRHLDRLDAILVTRMSDENTQGINAVLERKTVSPVYPQIGHLFANILEPKKDKEREKNYEDNRDKLLVNVIHEGNTMIENLRILNLKPQICFRDNVCDPINLYHKVGHGKLDMYVLNPSKDSREVREFLSRWHEDSGHLGKFRSGINVDGKEVWLPIANLVSICALLVWYPANPNDTITRLLFPGSTPQHKVFKGLEKLKKLECLKQPVCSPSSIQDSKQNMKNEKRKKASKMDNRNIQPDNTNNTLSEKKEKLKRRTEKLRKEKEDKEKRDKDKEEQEKADKEKKEKERQEKIERKKKADKEKKEKERQEKKEREAAIAAAKKEREEKEAIAKKEREEKEAAAKKEKEEKEASARKEREALRKEKDEKEAAKKKEREAKAQKELENKKEMIEQKNNENVIKKKTSSATISKSKVKESTSVKKSADTAIASRKIMPSKPTTAKLTTPPPSKLKKDENNKKVMETRKAAVAARSLRSKPDNDEKMKLKKVSGKKAVSRLRDVQGKVDGGSVADKVSEAIANGEIDNSRVIKDEQEEKEILVEKDKVGEIETIPVDDIEAARGNEDDEEAELQMIKDEEEEENQEPVPDIAEKMADVLNEQKAREEEKLPPLNLEKDRISYTHVKTPDEVDDLPEHEVVAHEMDEEEKIIMDENEKETKVLPDERSDASIEAVRDNETIEVPVEQKLKESEVPSSPEQEICIEKEELESNEKFSKEIEPEIQTNEESAKIEIKSEAEEKLSGSNVQTVEINENKFGEEIKKDNFVTELPKPSEDITSDKMVMNEDSPIKTTEIKTEESETPEVIKETSQTDNKIDLKQETEEDNSRQEAPETILTETNIEETDIKAKDDEESTDKIQTLHTDNKQELEVKEETDNKLREEESPEKMKSEEIKIPPTDKVEDDLRQKTPEKIEIETLQTDRSESPEKTYIIPTDDKISDEKTNSKLESSEKMETVQADVKDDFKQEPSETELQLKDDSRQDTSDKKETIQTDKKPENGTATLILESSEKVEKEDTVPTDNKDTFKLESLGTDNKVEDDSGDKSPVPTDKLMDDGKTDLVESSVNVETLQTTQQQDDPKQELAEKEDSLKTDNDLEDDSKVLPEKKETEDDSKSEKIIEADKTETIKTDTPLKKDSRPESPIKMDNIETEKNEKIQTEDKLKDDSRVESPEKMETIQTEDKLKDDSRVESPEKMETIQVDDEIEVEKANLKLESSDNNQADLKDDLNLKPSETEIQLQDDPRQDTSDMKETTQTEKTDQILESNEKVEKIQTVVAPKEKSDEPRKEDALKQDSTEPLVEDVTQHSETPRDVKDDSDFQQLTSTDVQTKNEIDDLQDTKEKPIDIEVSERKVENGDIRVEESSVQDKPITILEDESSSDGVEIIQETDNGTAETDVKPIDREVTPDLAEMHQDLDKKEFSPGVLEVTVHRASELVNNDKFSKSDPYVKLRYKKVEFRSKTISNNLNPEWNFSCCFDILNEEEDYIHINVYDDDFGTDNIQGCYSLPLELALNKLSEGQWFSLVGCESGKIYISSKFTEIKMEDKSTEKPIEINEDSSIDKSTLEKAEQLVSDIVEKAEKVVTEVEAQLGKEKTDETEADDSKEEPFNEISKGSREVIEKIVDQIDKDEAKLKVDETKTSVSTEISVKSDDVKTDSVADTFKEIEKESQEVVEKIELSMKQTKEIAASIQSGFVKLIVFEASNLANSERIEKSDPFVKIKFEDKEYKSRAVKNTSSPEWNFTANLMISKDVNSDIMLEILDSEELLGSCNLSVSEAIKETDKEAEWHQLENGKGGKILFSIIYIPDEEEGAEASEAALESKPEDKNSSDEKDEGELKAATDTPAFEAKEEIEEQTQSSATQQVQDEGTQNKEVVEDQTPEFKAETPKVKDDDIKVAGMDEEIQTTNKKEIKEPETSSVTKPEKELDQAESQIEDDKVENEAILLQEEKKETTEITESEVDAKESSTEKSKNENSTDIVNEPFDKEKSSKTPEIHSPVAEDKNTEKDLVKPSMKAETEIIEPANVQEDKLMKETDDVRDVSESLQIVDKIESVPEVKDTNLTEVTETIENKIDSSMKVPEPEPTSAIDAQMTDDKKDTTETIEDDKKDSKETIEDDKKDSKEIIEDDKKDSKEIIEDDKKDTTETIEEIEIKEQHDEKEKVDTNQIQIQKDNFVSDLALKEDISQSQSIDHQSDLIQDVTPVNKTDESKKAETTEDAKDTIKTDKKIEVLEENDTKIIQDDIKQGTTEQVETIQEDNKIEDVETSLKQDDSPSKSDIQKDDSKPESETVDSDDKLKDATRKESAETTLADDKPEQESTEANVKTEDDSRPQSPEEKETKLESEKNEAILADKKMESDSQLESEEKINDDLTQDSDQNVDSDKKAESTDKLETIQTENTIQDNKQEEGLIQESAMADQETIPADDKIENEKQDDKIIDEPKQASSEESKTSHSIDKIEEDSGKQDSEKESVADDKMEYENKQQLETMKDEAEVIPKVDNKTSEVPKEKMDITPNDDDVKESEENNKEETLSKTSLKTDEVLKVSSEAETEIKDTKLETETEYQSEETLQTKPSSLEREEKDESQPSLETEEVSKISSEQETEMKDSKLEMKIESGDQLDETMQNKSLQSEEEDGLKQIEKIEKIESEKSESKEDSTKESVENEKLMSTQTMEEKVDNDNQIENTTETIEPLKAGSEPSKDNKPEISSKVSIFGNISEANIESKTENTETERKESSSSVEENISSTPQQLVENEEKAIKECEILNQEVEDKDKLASEDRSQPSSNEVMDTTRTDDKEVNITDSRASMSVEPDRKSSPEVTEVTGELEENDKIKEVVTDNTNETIDNNKNSSGEAGVKELKEYLEKNVDDEICETLKDDQGDLTAPESKPLETKDDIELIGEIKDDTVVETGSSIKDLDETQSQVEEAEQTESLSSEGKVTKQLHGQLKVTIFKASNLENKDTLGKSDPYVVVKYNDTVLQSDSIKNSLQPEWNFEASFDLLGDEDIEITVKDSDIGRDDVLGNITVPVNRMISYEEETWLDLQNCKSGKILVSSEYKEQESEEEDDTEEADNIPVVDDKPPTEVVDELDTKEEPIKEEKVSKGLISSIIGSVGGYFYGSKKQVEDLKEKEVELNIPREFQMQPSSDSSETSQITGKKPVDFKDESEIIEEESEDQTKVTESCPEPIVEEPIVEVKVFDKVEATMVDTKEEKQMPGTEDILKKEGPSEKRLAGMEQKDITEKQKDIPEPIQKDTPVKEEPFHKDISEKEEPMQKDILDTVEKDIPVKEEPVQKDIPEKEEPVQEDVSEKEEPVKKDVSEKEDPIHKEVSEKEEPVQKDVSEKEEPVKKDVSEKEEPVKKDVSEKEDPIQKDVSEKEEPIQKDVSEKEEPIQKDVSEKEEPIQKDVSEKEEPIQKDVSEKEEPVQKDVSEKEEPIQKDVSEKDEPIQKDVSEKEEPIQKDVSEKEEPIQKDVSEKEEPIQKDVSEKEEPIQKDVSEKEEPVQKDVSEKEEPVQKDVSEKEEPIQKDVSEKEEPIQKDVSEKEEPVQKDVSEKEEPIQKDVSEKEEPIQKDVSEKEEPIQKDVSEKEEPIQKDVSEKEEPIQKDVSEKEEPVQKDVSEKEEPVQKDVSEKEEPIQKDVSEKEEPIQKDVSEKEEPIQKDVSEKEEPVQKDVSEKEEPIQKDVSEKQDDILDNEVSLQLDIPEKQEHQENGDCKTDSSESTANVSSQELKAKIVEGSEGITVIINNLLSLLEELSKSVASQQSIVCMKNELVHYERESRKIIDDAETDCLSEEKAFKITECLSTVVVDVKNYITESKELSEETKSSPVSSTEFEKLLSDCQNLLASIDKFMEDSPAIIESSPEEFLSAKDVISASTSFNDKREDDDELQNITEETEDEKHDDDSCVKVDLAEEVSPKTETEVIGKFDTETDGQTTDGLTAFPSLSSSEEGYHMDTPPTVSLVSDIQPCGVEIDVKSEPSSVTSSSEKMIVSESKSVSTTSSDYKCITESKSMEKNMLHVDSLHCTDSSTDDQMSSGTFSQDEISPRFAELPTQINVDKRRTQSTSDAVKIEPGYQAARRRSSAKERSLSMETRSTSIASDVSEQEIPPTTPRSDPAASPGSEPAVKFVYGDNVEKCQSMYIGSDDSEVSSESHLSTMQTTQQTISSSDESKVTKLVTEESTSVFESVIKMSENVTENILAETKTITKSTMMEVEESIVSQKEVATSDKSDEKLLKDPENGGQNITVVSTESSVVVTKTDTRTYSDVLKSDKYSESKQPTTTTVESDTKMSLGAEAAAEVLKTESVHQMVGSSSKAATTEKCKKLSYSEVVKSDSSAGRAEEKGQEDPIADWGKPLGLPSPVRPSTPAKQRRSNEETVDTNKMKDAIEPVWMDLAYVPHHGNSSYTTSEFFKRVRARYYVFSGVDPSREVFDALIEAKKTWENKEQEVTIIPTYDTDVLGYWVAENEELLAELKIDLAPSASRCTINLQDHATSCAAYRLEF